MQVKMLLPISFQMQILFFQEFVFLFNAGSTSFTNFISNADYNAFTNFVFKGLANVVANAVSTSTKKVVKIGLSTTKGGFSPYFCFPP